MSKREEIVTSFYNQYDESARLVKSRQGQLEYAVTMDYIHRHLKKGHKILEVGAGTGRYSVALAKEGYDMTAVELTPHNLDVLKENGKGLNNLHAYQGDALDLSRFEDNAFDVTLVFGPMYHLYEETDRHKAIDEAIRVTKKGGVLIFAFISAHSIMLTNYFYQWGTFGEGLEENFDENYNVKHFKEQLFTGYDIEEFEGMFKDKATEYLTTAEVDTVMEIIEKVPTFRLSDEDFERLVKYHLAICEKREMLGSATHLIYLCRKK